MLPRVVQARYVGEYVIWLKFNDGVEDEVNLKDELWGPVFEPLKDQKVFRRFRVHPDLHTIVWENEADFAPEFLHSIVQVLA